MKATLKLGPKATALGAHPSHVADWHHAAADVGSATEGGSHWTLARGSLGESSETGGGLSVFPVRAGRGPLPGSGTGRTEGRCPQRPFGCLEGALQAPPQASMWSAECPRFSQGLRVQQEEGISATALIRTL